VKVKELIKKLKEMDEDVEVSIVKQVDSEYQHIYGIDYFNEKHPMGGVTIHVSDHDKCSKE